MKRRNVELAKMRRPIKRNKINEGLYGSTFLYLRFLFVWILIVLADFSLEFRFEFLWPVYLLIRSVYDSFKYQGLAFSIFFLLIALTSDMVCYFFIPVQWLFFAASTYVWVQYVWHADKCICAPTIVFWVLFIYLEAAIRLRDIKHLPGHLDLCRPFAAHCIGYPVVTLGFGFKSYIAYRIRSRKQQHVAKENQFYMQLIQQALPIENLLHDPIEQLLCNSPINASGTPNPAATAAPNVQINTNNNSNANSRSHNNSRERNGNIPNGIISNSSISHGSKSHKRLMTEKNRDNSDHHNDHRHTDKHIDRQNKNNNSLNESHEKSAETTTEPTNKQYKKKDKKEQDKEKELQDYIQKLENENRKFRTELQQSRANEQELRIQVASLTTSEKSTKGEILILQRQIDDYQEKIQQAVAARQTDKQSIANLERRIMEERRLKSNLESQLNQERKNRKQEEARHAQVAAQQQTTRIECTESCKIRKRELESELLECRQTQHWAEDRYKSLELENQAMAKQLRDTDRLMNAVSVVQEKNTHLENSLSAETRIKLDLFSALGEAKRQLEISDSTNKAQEKEIEALRSKIADILAVLPNETFNNNHQGQLMSCGGSNSKSPSCCGSSNSGSSICIHGSPSPSSSSPTSLTPSSAVASVTGLTMPRVRLAESPPIGLSKLDPNATAYTPKNSLIASTEA